MGRATAGLGDDADDQRPVERGRLGGREVLGDDDAGLGEGRDAGCGLPQHGGDRPRPDVAQVGDPLGEVAAERRELRGILSTAAEIALAALRRQLLAGGLVQSLVLGDERRGLEDLLGGVVGVPGPSLGSSATDAAALTSSSAASGISRAASPAGAATGGATWTTGP